MSKVQFRVIVLLNILFMFGSGVTVSIEESNLPAELVNYIESSNLVEFNSNIDYFFLVIDLIGVSSIFGLLFFANWARYVYILTIPIVTIMMYFNGPSVTGPISTVVIELQLITNGVILALLFFPSIVSLFKKYDIKTIQDEIELTPPAVSPDRRGQAALKVYGAKKKT